MSLYYVYKSILPRKYYGLFMYREAFPSDTRIYNLCTRSRVKMSMPEITADKCVDNHENLIVVLKTIMYCIESSVLLFWKVKKNVTYIYIYIYIYIYVYIYILYIYIYIERERGRRILIFLSQILSSREEIPGAVLWSKTGYACKKKTSYLKLRTNKQTNKQKNKTKKKTNKNLHFIK